MDGRIDLDVPARPAAVRHRSSPVRVAAVLLLALAAAAPQGAPVVRTAARAIPLPSYCTGRPIPGGRLNIVSGDRYVILDATTNTVVGAGPCPRQLRFGPGDGAG